MAKEFLDFEEVGPCLVLFLQVVDEGEGASGWIWNGLFLKEAMRLLGCECSFFFSSWCGVSE